MILLSIVLTAATLGQGDPLPSAFELPARGLCAHRGASGSHPENTLAAFREAVRLGAHMIELDVYLTKDKRLVVIHDRTVDRTTDGTGNVSDLTLAQLKRLDAGSWKAPEFKDERIPTLRESLAVMPLNVWLNVHLKGGAELGASVARAIAETGRSHQAFLACGVEAAGAARKVEAGILICNMERQGGSWQYVNSTVAMNTAFIQLAGDVGAEFPAQIRKLKEAGIRINYFGTDSPDELRQLFDAGVEFPLVNEVSKLVKTAGELGIVPLAPVFGEGASQDGNAPR